MPIISSIEYYMKMYTDDEYRLEVMKKYPWAYPNQLKRYESLLDV